MNLVVISHTRHFLNEEGACVGWGPTVRELDALARYFDRVYHLAYSYEGIPSQAFLPYKMPNVEFVPLRAAGGETFAEKLGVLICIPGNLRIINSYLKRADAVQVRVPTALGLYVLPWISWVSERPGFRLWVKYAGNWIQRDAPLTYNLQRWFLKRNFQKSIVTINGNWPDQPAHCLSFENPCLTADELGTGQLVALDKDFKGLINILFVGRVEEAKGIGRLIQALSFIKLGLLHEVIIVGEGNVNQYRQLATKSPIPVSFKGGLSRGQLNHYYTNSHLLVLPSDASEGFPKVIAEACCFGCVPVVSDVSSISQYINSQNGLVLSQLEPKTLAEEIELLLDDRTLLKEKSLQAAAMASRFSYDHYCSRIMQEVLPGMTLGV